LKELQLQDKATIISTLFHGPQNNVIYLFLALIICLKIPAQFDFLPGTPGGTLRITGRFLPMRLEGWSNTAVRLAGWRRVT
jgi:hypothetical protein